MRLEFRLLGDVAMLADGPRPAADTPGASSDAAPTPVPVRRRVRTLVARLAASAMDARRGVVRLHPEIDRDRVLEGLAARGIPARPYFSPLHLQPFYRERFGFKPGDFPVTERVAASTLALPFSSRLPDDDVAYVAEMLRDVALREADTRAS